MTAHHPPTTDSPLRLGEPAAPLASGITMRPYQLEAVTVVEQAAEAGVRRYRITVRSHLTRGEASDQLSALAANNWRRPDTATA